MPNNLLGYKSEDWSPTPPTLGPPLPKWLKMHWPWYKEEVPDYVLNSSLQLYLPLWHSCMVGSSLTSRDRNGHICTVVGAVWGKDGRTFDGNSYINCGAGASLAIPDLSPWTYLSWVKVTGDPQWDMLAQETQVHTLRSVFLHYTTKLYTRDVNGTHHACEVGTLADEWHLVGFVMDNARNLTGYKDGVSYGAFTNPILDSSMVVRYIGKYTGTYAFTGIMGDIWFYNRQLSSDEMKQIYQDTKERYGA